MDIVTRLNLNLSAKTMSKAEELVNLCSLAMRRQIKTCFGLPCYCLDLAAQLNRETFDVSAAIDFLGITGAQYTKDRNSLRTHLDLKKITGWSFKKLALKFGSAYLVPVCEDILTDFRSKRKGVDIDWSSEDIIIAIFLAVCKAIRVLFILNQCNRLKSHRTLKNR